VKGISVTIYGAPRCCLCDEAEAVLRGLEGELGLVIEKVDITASEALEATYRPEIPVVFLEGRKAYKYRVDEADLRRRVERLRASER